MAPRRPERSTAHQRWARASWLLAAAAACQLACASSEPREPIPIPATASLRGATELLLSGVEEVEGAPGWVHRPRVDQEVVYGVGVESGRRSADQALYRAMREAQTSVASWLERQGVDAISTRRLHAPLPVPLERIGFERMAFDSLTDRWYVLARFDLDAGRAALREHAEGIEASLRRAQATVLNEWDEQDERIRAALAILYGIDRRAQYAAAYHALGGDVLELAPGLEEDVLQEQADDLLSQHGVRILTEGVDVPGLEDIVASAMGRVHLRSEAFGRGQVAVRMRESRAFEPASPYLEIDGRVEIAIEGGDARTYSTPFRVVSSGVDVEEARFRATRSIHLEVERILQTTLRTMAESGS